MRFKHDKKEDIVLSIENDLWEISGPEKIFIPLANFSIWYLSSKARYIKFSVKQGIDRSLSLLGFSTSYLFIAVSLILLVLSRGISAEKIIMVMIFAFVGYYLPASKYKKILSDKEKLIRREFPAIIDRLLILLEAGYSTTMAWAFMGELLDTGNEIESIVCKLIKQMKLGLSEDAFYKELQEALDYPLVIKFCSICSQNIRKGGSDLSAQLKELSDEAMVQRRWAAIKAGEEASGKMIVPLSLIFIGVLIIVMVPAALQLMLL